MAFTLATDFTNHIQSLFENDSNRYIKHANAYMLSGSTKVTGSAVTLEVKDSTNTQRYFLTTATNPSIQTSSSVYFVDSINVTAFPAGDIALIWAITSGSTDYVLTSSVGFDLAPAITIVTGQTQTLQDFKVTLGQPKVFSVRLRDNTGNVVDASNAKIVVWDSTNGTIVNTFTASLNAVASGLWTASGTLSTNAYSPALDRYEAYWTADTGTGELEVQGSRQRLEVFGALSSLSAGPITYSSNEDLRKSIVGLQKIISAQVREPGEIEIVLNQKRYLCSLEIHGWIQTRPNATYSQDLLKALEINMVHRDCLVDSNAFSKFAGENTQIKEIDKKISRLKSVIFGSVFSIKAI